LKKIFQKKYSIKFTENEMFNMIEEKNIYFFQKKSIDSKNKCISLHSVSGKSKSNLVIKKGKKIRAR